MAEHDYSIANDTGANVRADINNALSAIASNNSKATEPSTTFAYMWWADTANDLLKQRNAANNAWISILTLSTGVPIAGAGGPSLGDDSIIRTNKTEITSSIPFPSSAPFYNGMTAGPISITGSGVTVTVPSGNVWTIV